MIEDINEHKQAEEALQQSEELYRGLVENINEVVYCTDEMGKVTYISPNIEVIGGYTQSEVLKKDFTQFVHPEDLNGRIENFKKAMHGKGSVGEYRFITKDKKIIWIRTNAGPITKNGRVVGVQGVLNDITKRKEMEEALRQTTERLETLIYSMPVGIAIIDTETHKIVDINPKAALMIGAPSDRIIGSLCHDFICMSEKGRCPVTDLGHTIENAERGLLATDGEIIPVHKTVMPIEIQGRDLLLECFVDIRDHKRAEKERLEKEKLQGVVEVAGAICHELNHPLQAVSGYNQLMIMDAGKNDPQKPYLEKIKEQIERMGSITGKLMKITRYETKEYLEGRIIDIDRAANF